MHCRNRFGRPLSELWMSVCSSTFHSSTVAAISDRLEASVDVRCRVCVRWHPAGVRWETGLDCEQAIPTLEPMLAPTSPWGCVQREVEHYPEWSVLVKSRNGDGKDDVGQILGRSWDCPWWQRRLFCSSITLILFYLRFTSVDRVLPSDRDSTSVQPLTWTRWVHAQSNGLAFRLPANTSSFVG